MGRHVLMTAIGLLLFLGSAATPTLAAAVPLVDPAETPETTWYFAESSTQPPFDTWFLVQNPTNQTANVRFTFQLQSAGGTAGGASSCPTCPTPLPRVVGGVHTREVTVGPHSRLSLHANPIIPNQAFSTVISSDQQVFAERSMFVGFDGTTVTGVRAPEKIWLFAEGSTQPPFQTWLLLQNPDDQETTAAITYMREDGTSVAQRLVLPPNSRASVFANQVLPNAAFSSRVEGSLPIVVERAMYRLPGNAALADSGATDSSPWGPRACVGCRPTPSS